MKVCIEACFLEKDYERVYEESKVFEESQDAKIYGETGNKEDFSAET